MESDKDSEEAVEEPLALQDKELSEEKAVKHTELIIQKEVGLEDLLDEIKPVEKLKEEKIILEKEEN